jgi:hypothetical protein
MRVKKYLAVLNEQLDFSKGFCLVTEATYSVQKEIE